MIAGLSKVITLYLAPVLALTSIILILLAFLSPVLLLQSRVALLVVSPSLSLTNPGTTSSVDGPTLFLGALGSCSRTSAAANVKCEPPSLSPKYDLSALPNNAPDLLSAPTATTPAFIAISIGFTIIFFFLFTLMSLRHKLGARLATVMDRPGIQRISAWVGVFGFMIGLTAFLVIRMWFGKAVEDFNRSISELGGNGPKIAASTSNGFIMIWVAYVFYAVPLVCALARLHVTATVGK
ncbi:hypothetical protein K488DRAFT_80076 [Vararia minispora EC-137]|uniref:Uncharacterized protein n=1 Tax=Vararia minispora EC-137 TaxID=1314806 RepID=A0ACB8QDE1_9AGAM|nr:hypothetical protein K488DRAFT_80076 [Vararia minispora EC-137]